MLKMMNQNQLKRQEQEHKRSLERQQVFDEMNNLQTSLHSKKQQDQNEYFRKTLKQEKLMNVTSTNLTLKSEITKAQDSMKTTQLKQEKEWVNSIVEV